MQFFRSAWKYGMETYMRWTDARPGQRIEIQRETELERNRQRRLRRPEEHMARVTREYQERLQSIAKDKESVKIT
jgi:hypothetical protein